MALDDSVLSELLEMFRAGDGLDLVREPVRLVLQELIETEAAEVIGARRYERTEARSTERNGHRPRLLATQAGDVELKIPKLRAGSFLPSLLEPRRRIDQALYTVIAQAYVEGISTRSVDDLVQAMGIASGISRSEVSRICRIKGARMPIWVLSWHSPPLAGHHRPWPSPSSTSRSASSWFL